VERGERSRPKLSLQKYRLFYGLLFRSVASHHDTRCVLDFSGKTAKERLRDHAKNSNALWLHLEYLE
jgi:hypothetical protein